MDTEIISKNPKDKGQEQKGGSMFLDTFPTSFPEYAFEHWLWESLSLFSWKTCISNKKELEFEKLFEKNEGRIKRVLN